MLTPCSMTAHIMLPLPMSKVDLTTVKHSVSRIFSLFHLFQVLNEHPDWIANFGNTLRKSEVDEHAVEAQGSSSSSWQPRFPQLEAAHVEQKLEESKKHPFWHVWGSFAYDYFLTICFLEENSFFLISRKVQHAMTFAQVSMGPMFASWLRLCPAPMDV